MQKKKRLPPETYSIIVELYSSGKMSSQDLALQYGVSYTQIRNILIKHGDGLTMAKYYTALKATNPSEEARNKMSLAKKGRKLSSEHREKMSKAHPGKGSHSPEVRAKLSKNAKEQMKLNPEAYARFRKASFECSIARTLSLEERRIRKKQRTSYYHLLYRVAKNGRYGSKTSATEILQYSRDEFLTHIQGTFSEEMSWEDRSSFHIDHIIPVVVFQDLGIDDPVIINALPNLRALSAEENLRRNRKYDMRNFHTDVEKILTWLEERNIKSAFFEDIREGINYHYLKNESEQNLITKPFSGIR